MTRREPVIVAGGLVLMALIGVAAVVASGNVGLAARGIETAATVVDPGELIIDANDPDYYRDVVLEFEDRDGALRREVVHRSAVSSTGRIGQGSVITITVDPRDPSVLSTNSRADVRRGVLFATILLPVILLVAVAVLVFSRLRSSRHEPTGA